MKNLKLFAKIVHLKVRTLYSTYSKYKIYIFILEVAAILFKFIQLLKDGNMEQCEIEYQKLPTMNSDWLNQSKTQTPQAVVQHLFCFIKQNFVKLICRLMKILPVKTNKLNQLLWNTMDGQR